jgi:hypothetical protein
MARGLSDLQKDILRIAYQNRSNMRMPEQRLKDFNHGIPENFREQIHSYDLYIKNEDIFYNEYIGIITDNKTNKVKASVSRAFKRLQQRELIERDYYAYHNHMFANLTIKGIKIARELANP